MTTHQLDSLKVMLCEHEGIKMRPYYCPAQKLTIGVGRNLDDLGLSVDEKFLICGNSDLDKKETIAIISKKGISYNEAMLLLENDIQRVDVELRNAFSWYDHASQAVQTVLIDMCFNLGISRLKKFKNTLEHFENGEISEAIEEMKKSRWYTQVHQRADNLIAILTAA